VLRRALEARADLIVVNRFGSMEREGRGLAQEMLAAMAERIPVLTVVHGIHGDIAFSFSIGIVHFGATEGEGARMMRRWLGHNRGTRDIRGAGGTRAVVAEIEAEA